MIHLSLEFLFLTFLAAGALVLTQEHARAGSLARLRAWLAIEGAGMAPAAKAPVQDSGLRLVYEDILQRLGIRAAPRQAIVALGMILLLGTAAGALVSAVAGVGLGAALLLLTYAFLNIRAAYRLNRIGSLMPGFFDRVRQLLSAGNSLPTAFSRAVQSSQPALVDFFAPTVRRLHNGAPFAESLAQCAADCDLYELHLFSTAVSANIRFGGSLTHALNNLVIYLRRRAAIERELRASTAQIRASAWVLGLLPSLVAAAIVVQNRDYATWFLVHSAGRTLLLYCGVSQLIGAVLMRTVVKTKF